jgi:transketolase
MKAAVEQQLRRKASVIRRLTLECIGACGVGHIGGSLSMVEILVLLYYRVMRNAEPQYLGHPDRDTLVLSKGHGSPALYAVLADKGFIPLEQLLTLNRGGTSLPSHCDMNKTPGIDFTTGSLGQGISAAVGIALANRMLERDAAVFCIVGDGECQEGQVWEAAMCASHYRLDRLIVFLDCNRLQFDGTTAGVMNLEDLAAKWRSFGWHAVRRDGHSFPALDRAAAAALRSKGRPSVIVCDTVKAKGFSPGEGRIASHNMRVTDKQIAEAMEELRQAEEQDEIPRQL